MQRSPDRAEIQEGVWVIIPAMNDQTTVSVVLNELPEVTRVIVVDNGSTDRTAQVAELAGAKVVSEPRRGYGWACLRGMQAIVDSVEQGDTAPETVVFLSGDNSDPAGHLSSLTAPIAAGEADFVLGSRRSGTGKNASMPWQRALRNRVACLLMRWMFGASYTDIGRFRAIRYETLRQLGMVDRNFGWSVEMQIKAARAGLTTLEVPVPYRRSNASAKIAGKVQGAYRAGWNVLYTIAKYGWLTRKPQPVTVRIATRQEWPGGPSLFAVASTVPTDPEVMAKSRTPEPIDDAEDTRRLVYVGLIAVGCWLALCVVSRLSGSIDSQADPQRPFMTVMGMFALVFFGHIGALLIGLRIRSRRRLTEMIVAAAVVFRITLLPTVPIQELDIYRYLWDGAVSTSGVNPYRYSPDQIKNANGGQNLPESLEELVELSRSDPAMGQALAQVQPGDLTTIYPPVSQAVFAMASLVTPPTASLYERVVILKAWLVGFDLATLWVLISLLRIVHRHVAWSIAYAWSPLVLKEIANAGHLDAVAVFLTMLAIFLATRLLWPNPEEKTEEPSTRDFAWVGAALGFAVSAKLYPIILLPWLVGSTAKRQGWAPAGVVSGTSLLIVLATCWPLVFGYGGDTAQAPATQQQTGGISVSEFSPAPIVTRESSAHGLTSFLKYWEMNDFLFMIVVENLKPTVDAQPGSTPWFSLVPESWRSRVLAPLSGAEDGSTTGSSPREDHEAAFVLSRVITGAIFLILMGVFAWYASRAEHTVVWLSYAFLTIAWFWLLSPAQNPWYWVWALPLVGFARSRVWLAMGGLVCWGPATMERHSSTS
ncbi:unnamed protein product [Cladocopium goreaui]|uniref:Uncharacterized glycosyltransferase Mb0553 n=1 Tax=Cladocopium goreaui TaxID=2562237 RepID=A0A9P1BF32_9DINO|nr:unnamed protein product [Cladocopium goreaui]